MAEQGWSNEKSTSIGKAETVPKVEKVDDDEDAFDALEAEQKEFLKVLYLFLGVLS